MAAGSEGVDVALRNLRLRCFLCCNSRDGLGKALIGAAMQHRAPTRVTA